MVQHLGEVLLIRRRVPEADLVWQFPAGKVEAGESVLMAAAREALEEAGVTVEPLRVIGERVHPVSGRRITYVVCRWLSGKPTTASPREVAEAAWVSLDELAERIPGGVYPPVWQYIAGPALP
ncbi:NUDIX hydrolase [Streptomyces huasconensis]|uniref:NUDIX hydrolase n=1 Tax=Streptomyces huasconensis TaxID=1854574 RepID=UPI0037031156